MKIENNTVHFDKQETAVFGDFEVILEASGNLSVKKFCAKQIVIVPQGVNKVLIKGD